MSATFGQRGVLGREMRAPVRLVAPDGGFGPFIAVIVPSALFAGILFKITTIIAPVLRLEAFFWGLTLSYLYFMLSRATYILARSNASTSGRLQLDKPAITFHRGFMAVALRPIVVVLFCLLGLDLILSGVGIAGIGQVAVLIGLLTWVLAAPFVLFVSGHWAGEGVLSIAAARDVYSRNRFLIMCFWAFPVGVIAGFGLNLLEPLYSAIRALAVQRLHVRGFGIFVLSALFNAVLIALLVWAQAEFGAWISAKVMRREQAMALAPAGRDSRDAFGRPKLAVAKWPRTISRSAVLQARLGGALVVLLGIALTGYETAERVMAVPVTGTISRATPMCEVSWEAEDLFHQKKIPQVRRLFCFWAPGLVDALKDAKKVRTTPGTLVTVNYATPGTGAPDRFVTFVPGDGAAFAKDRAIGLDYLAWRGQPARITPAYPPLPVGPFYIVFGLLATLVPTLRHRLFGTPYAPPSSQGFWKRASGRWPLRERKDKSRF